MKKKKPENPKKRGMSLVRSSAAEYLTFAASGGSSGTAVEMRYEDENIWLTQKMMATLYDVSVPAVNQHLKRIFDDNELQQESTIKKYLIVQKEGDRQVRREVEHYNLQAIIAVGFKIENERAVHFRKWANQIVKDYTIQGWTMDVERLKHGGSKVILTACASKSSWSRIIKKRKPLRTEVRSVRKQKLLATASLRDAIPTHFKLVDSDGCMISPFQPLSFQL